MIELRQEGVRQFQRNGAHRNQGNARRGKVYHAGALDTIGGMKIPSSERGRTRSSVWQSVAVHRDWIEVERAAAARKNLDATYRRFMAEADPERKGEAGKDLIRAIFGKDAIAEDPIL